MPAWLTILAVNLCLVPAGMGVLAAIGHPLRFRPGLAYVSGVASVGVISTLLLLAGAGLQKWEFLLLCGVLATPLLVRRGNPRAPQPIERAPRLLVGLGSTLVVGFLALLAVDLVHQPLWEYDAWADWTAKAKAIVLLGNLDPAFLRGSVNASYPLLVPSLETFDFRFAGLDTVAIHMQFWCLTAGLVAALYDLLRNRVRPAVLWTLLPTLALAPQLAIQSAYAIADVPLACFVALAGVAALTWLRDGATCDLALVALFATAAVATKTEGVLYAGALGAVLLPLAYRRSRRAAVAVAVAGVVVLIGVLPWAEWARSHHLGNWFASGNGVAPPQKAHFGRVVEVVPYLVKEIADPTSWLLLVPLALGAVALACLAGRRAEAVLALGPPALVFLGLVWIYWHTPLVLHVHLATSARRVIVGLDLYLLALAPLLIEGALGRAGRRES
jgi:hypothetical protein